MIAKTNFSQMVDDFKRFLANDEKSISTIDKYARDVCLFLSFAKEKEINKSLVLEYRASLVREYALSSVNSMVAALNSFLRFVGLGDCCVKQLKIQKEIYSSEKGELTKADYLALIRTAEKKNNERLSLVIQTICGTGIRVSELEYITCEAVNRSEATVHCKGKSRKVFIVSALRKKLMRFAKQNGISKGPVFVTQNGKPLNRSNIWRDMKALCIEAGVLPEKVFPHNLRHLFARTFYGMEKDIAKLADILGHSSINTTRIYIISTGKEHRRRMENMRLII